MTVTERPFPGWRQSASRFGVEPITVEQFAQRFALGSPLGSDTK
jgi:hypothetical protein